MAIEDFTEKKIRRAILNKIRPRWINKKGPHWKGYIYSGDILVTKVKIPNEHTKIMKGWKSKYIAADLRLENNDDFNDVINCDKGGTWYYQHIQQFV